MKPVGQLVAMLALVLPAPAFAQAVSQEALAGVWIANLPSTEKGQQVTELDTLTLRQEGTIKKSQIVFLTDSGPKKPLARNANNGTNWSLSGDTLRFYWKSDTANKGIFYKAALNNDQLTLNLLLGGAAGFNTKTEIYKRASGKP